MKDLVQFDVFNKKINAEITSQDKIALFNSVLRLSLTELKDFINSQLDINPYLISESLFRRDYKIARQVIWGDEENTDKIFSNKTLTDVLHEQIELEIEDSEAKRIAIAITSRLDKYGYFRNNTTFLARQLDTSAEYIEHVLAKLQGFEPVGVYARDLPDCLRIQLAAQNKLNQEIYIMLSNLDLLVAGKLQDLQTLAGADKESFSKMISDIRQLEHNPIKAFTHAPADITLPDVFTVNHAGKTEIEINNFSIPDIKFNDGYIELGLEADHIDDDKFVKHATMLIDVIVKRTETLKSMMTRVFKSKPEIEGKRILITRDTELLLCDKYKLTPRELKKIFSTKFVDIEAINHSFHFVGY